MVMADPSPYTLRIFFYTCCRSIRFAFFSPGAEEGQGSAALLEARQIRRREAEEEGNVVVDVVVRIRVMHLVRFDWV